MKNAVVVSKSLTDELVDAQKKEDKKNEKKSFKNKKFQNLNSAEKDDLLKVIAVTLKIIEE